MSEAEALPEALSTRAHACSPAKSKLRVQDEYAVTFMNCWEALASSPVFGTDKSNSPSSPFAPVDVPPQEQRMRRVDIMLRDFFPINLFSSKIRYFTYLNETVLVGR